MSSSRDDQNKGKARAVTPPLVEAISIPSNSSLLLKASSSESLSSQDSPSSEPELIRRPSPKPKPNNPQVLKVDWKFEEGFPDGGVQEKGPHAGKYTHTTTKQVAFAKRHKDAFRRLAERITGSVNIGLTELCLPAAKNNTPKMSFAFSPEYTDIDFPDETGEHVYLVINALDKWSDLYVDASYINKKPIPHARRPVFTYIAPGKDQLRDPNIDNAIAKHRYDLDQLLWFLILKFIVKDNDVHPSNFGTLDDSPIRGLIKAVERANMLDAGDYKKIVTHLKNVIKHFANKESEIETKLDSSQDENTQKSLNKTLIEIRLTKGEFVDLCNMLEAPKYNNANFLRDLNQNRVVEADRKRTGLPIGRIDYDAALEDLTDDWNLNESTLKNLVLFVSKKPVDHGKTFNGAMQSPEFAHWLSETVNKINKEAIKSILEEPFLEMVQMFGSKPIFDFAVYMGMRTNEKFEGIPLENHRESYAALLKSQKAELINFRGDSEARAQLKKSFEQARMQHPLIKSIQDFLATKLFKRSQHCNELILPIKISAECIRHKRECLEHGFENVPHEITDLRLKLFIEDHYEDINQYLPESGNFAFFGVDESDASFYTKRIREVKAEVDLCHLLDRELAATPENLIANGDPTVIKRISDSIRNGKFPKRVRENVDDIYAHYQSRKRVRIADPAEQRQQDEVFKSFFIKVKREVAQGERLRDTLLQLQPQGQQNVPPSAIQVDQNEPIDQRGSNNPSPTLAKKLKTSFHEVYFDMEGTRLQNANGLEYIIKTLVDYPNETSTSTIAWWLLTTGLVIPTLLKNTLKLATEFLPKTVETLCDHGADKCRAYIDNEKNNPNLINIGLASLGYVTCVAGKYIARATRLVTMRVTSPITSIRQAYAFGKSAGDSVSGKDSFTGKAMGFALGALSGSFSLASYIVLGVVTAPVVAAVAPAVVGTKITNAVAGFSGWLSSVTGPVMGWIGSHITAGLGAIGIHTIGGFSITPSAVALGAVATAVISEASLLVRSGLSYFRNIFKSKAPESQSEHKSNAPESQPEQRPDSPVWKGSAVQKRATTPDLLARLAAASSEEKDEDGLSRIGTKPNPNTNLVAPTPKRPASPLLQNSVLKAPAVQPGPTQQDSSNPGVRPS